MIEPGLNVLAEHAHVAPLQRDAHGVGQDDVETGGYLEGHAGQGVVVHVGDVHGLARVDEGVLGFGVIRGLRLVRA